MLLVLEIYDFCYHGAATDLLPQDVALLSDLSLYHIDLTLVICHQAKLKVRGIKTSDLRLK